MTTARRLGIFCTNLDIYFSSFTSPLCPPPEITASTPL
jgi:hypothetical protein